MRYLGLPWKIFMEFCPTLISFLYIFRSHRRIMGQKPNEITFFRVFSEKNLVGWILWHVVVCEHQTLKYGKVYSLLVKWFSNLFWTADTTRALGALSERKNLGIKWSKALHNICQFLCTTALFRPVKLHHTHTHTLRYKIAKIGQNRPIFAKINIGDGGNTALQTVDTVHMVYTVDIASTVDMVYTVYMVYTVDMGTEGE